MGAKFASAAEVEHVGRDPADLRIEHHPVSGDAGAVVRFLGEGMYWLRDIASTLSPGQPIYVMLYAVAIVFFCFLLHGAGVQCPRNGGQPEESGAFRARIRPGDQTARYIDKILMR